MVAGTDSYVDFVLEQLAPLGGVVSARFFGGVGLSREGTLFAMIMGSTLYFRVDDVTRPKYIAMGSSCFSYATKKGPVDVTRFYGVPAETLEDQEQLVALAGEAFRVASGAKQQRSGSVRRSRAKRAPAKRRRRKEP
ncbi:MAG TPA: TfoX/Sxy family protein [Steroidobacteraceae bacterium]|jgi:DNA transformation protein